MEIAEIVCRKCAGLCLLNIPTNGQLPEKAAAFAGRLRSLFPHIKVLFTISMDGPSAVHNAIRGDGSAWSKALETFAALKSEGHRNVYFGHTLSRFNPGMFGPMFEELRRAYPALRVEDFHFNAAHQSAHYYRNQDADPRADPAFLRRELRELRAAGGSWIKGCLFKKYVSLLPRYLDSHRMPLTCQAMSATCFLDPAGDIYPCTSYSLKVASLKRDGLDLRQIWKSAEAREARNKIRARVCPGCWTPCEAYPAILGSLLKKGG
jgi:sulfatase maturation enzyme AslB (radical SAM superfamily)